MDDRNNELSRKKSINISGDSKGGAFIEIPGLDASVGPYETLERFLEGLRTVPDSPHTPSSGDSVTLLSPLHQDTAGSTPETTTPAAQPWGPLHQSRNRDSRPEAIESIWDLSGDAIQAQSEAIASPEPSDDLPQPGRLARTTGTPPPPSPGASTVSGVNQEGDYPGEPEDNPGRQEEAAKALRGRFTSKWMEAFREPGRQEEAANALRGRFTSKWMEAFRGCHRGNLDEMMEEFTRELLPTANKLLARAPVTNVRSARHPPADRIPEEAAPESSAAKTSQRRRRNQHRHQQRRARRHQHQRPEDASKLQKLYGRYPRKALRKVLGEESPYYSRGRDRLQQSTT
ncbi:LOW QUALITY PROTEIN: reverse transcriptase [Elysia marginata]|uniref:Reverse transcriptase n=1 Tax=Elysia marginata TaxID=1093978 RepID=A0AAV4JRY9_9GAST|nr:LOW QUALITY PROTEIN: reverse transcriptase [Elysia marginata]